MKKPNSSDILDAEGLADFLGIALSTAYGLIHRIGFKASARRWIVHKESVLEYMRSNAGREQSAT